MRRLYTLIATTALCSAIAAQEPAAVRVLTFEDADFKGTLEQVSYKPDGMTAANYWSSLIDSQQYNGPLLYDDNAASNPYRWHDAGNTWLASGINRGYGDYKFWGGGAVLSNYVSSNYNGADYTRQLEAYNPGGQAGGADGSANFLVCNGFLDTENDWGVDSRPVFSFGEADGKPLYAYITLGTYGLDAAFNGTNLSAPVKADDYVEIVAQSYDENGVELAAASIRLVDGSAKIVSEWTKWDLTPLGQCRTFRLNIVSTLTNDYGLAFPAYYLLDNIAVEDLGNHAGVDNVAVDGPAVPSGIYTLTGVRLERIEAPGIYIVDGKKVIVK